MATAPAATGWSALKAAGNTHYSAGRTEAAIEQYSAALGDAEIPQADRATILCNRAQCYLKLGNNAAAIEDCTACLTIQPDNMKALFRRGSALEAMNDKKAALKDFRDALRVNPSLADASMAVRRLEAALGEAPSRSAAPSKGSKGGGAAVTEEDARQLEETKQRVKDVALQKVKAKQQQEATAKEKRSIDLTLSQIEGLPPSVSELMPLIASSSRPGRWDKHLIGQGTRSPTGTAVFSLAFPFCT